MTIQHNLKEQAVATLETLPEQSLREAVTFLDYLRYKSKLPSGRERTERATPALPTTPEELGWPPGFFQEVAGGWQGEPLIREEQGEYEIRDELQ